MLIAFGVVLLLLEIIKGARPGSKYLTDHLLSLIVFGAAAAEFLLWPKFGTSTFLLLTLLAMVDFISGIALRARRGSRTAPAASTRGRTANETATVAVEQRRAPEPSPEPTRPQASSAVPSAGSVAEAVPPDHPEPKTEQPVVAPGEASPQVQSPGLQPTGGTPASQA
jgi:predicted lipid-binding transport protein (Tim44 family)